MKAKKYGGMSDGCNGPRQYANVIDMTSPPTPLRASVHIIANGSVLEASRISSDM